MRAQALEDAAESRVAAATPIAADRSGSARLHPGVLRNAGNRRRRAGRDRRSAHEQGACQAEHGRRGRGGGGLSQRADAERHRSRGDRRTATRCSSSSTNSSQYCDAGTKVIVIGKVNDIVLYRQLMARGVSEYLVWPFGVVEFVQAISHLFRAPGAKPVGRVISVDRRQGRRRRLDDRAQSRLAARRPGSKWRRSSPISISASAPRASTSTRIRRRASPRRCSRPSASTRLWSIACCRNAATI